MIEMLHQRRDASNISPRSLELFKALDSTSASMICGHNYATCIRPLDGYCCIEYTPITFEVPSWIPDTPGETTCLFDGTDANIHILACAGAGVCQRNFVIIPGAQSDVTCKADGTLCWMPPNGPERYCGTIFDPEGTVAVNSAGHSPVTSCQRPFRFFGVTADCGTPGFSTTTTTDIEGVGSASGGIKGWSFTYRQIAGGC